MVRINLRILEMAKNKTGLHKEVKSIFEGVPIPGNDFGQSGVGLRNGNTYESPKTSAGQLHIPEVPKPKQPIGVPKREKEHLESSIEASNSLNSRFASPDITRSFGSPTKKASASGQA